MFAQLIVFCGVLFSLIVGVAQIKFVREFFGQAAPEYSNIQVYTNSIVGTYERPWRNLAQGGEDDEWRLEPLTSQVKALNPQYIRIDHVFDFYNIVQGSSGNLSFDFSKLDVMLNDILATGAKPYIALSYMPPELSGGDITGAPQNYTDWQIMVQRTIEHVSGTRGISDVYYEVWNEPDLFGGWKYYGSKNYLTLYSYASIGAKSARGVKPFKLGGPATTGFYKNWIEALVEAADKYNFKLDFVSWHRYHTDVDQYRDDMIEIRDLMREYPQYESTLEYHITEWGHDSENSAGYDSNYSAAHTVAAAIEMVGVVDKAFTFEIQDGKDPNGQEYWGRWGLFTHPDFGTKAKPRYWALRMLDRIPNQRVQLLGKGSWVKALAGKNYNDNIEVVLANYDQKGNHGENVPITFVDIEPGSYTITKELNNGRVFTENVATTEAKLKTGLYMPTNSVGYVTLQKTR